MNTTDWDIKSRSDHCVLCERKFEDRESYETTLTFGEEGYRRIDHCDGCHEKVDPDWRVISSWKAVFHAPPPKAEEPLKKENAEDLLRRLMEEEDEAQRNAIYILAVMLERKKILVEKEVKFHNNGDKVIFYEHRKSGDTFVIPDPQLKLAELEPVQEEVVVLLGGQPRGASAATEEVDEANGEAGNAETSSENTEASNVE